MQVKVKSNWGESDPEVVAVMISRKGGRGKKKTKDKTVDFFEETDFS